MDAIKLIFVDDDPDDRDLIHDGLLTLGAASFLVFDSYRPLFGYLATVKEEQLPEVIVLDLNMPEMGGMEILRQLKTSPEYQQIAVYILTTSQSAAFKERCVKEGAAGFYSKPNTISELHAILNEIYETV
jgi:CheY-like chemotaxis protein